MALNCKIINKYLEGKSDEEILSAIKGRKLVENSIVKNKIFQILLKDPSHTQKGIIDELFKLNINMTQSNVRRIPKKWIILEKDYL